MKTKTLSAAQKRIRDDRIEREQYVKLDILRIASGINGGNNDAATILKSAEDLYKFIKGEQNNV